MPDSNAFKTVHVQAVLYTPGSVFRAGKALGYFLGSYGERFTGEPLSLPIPADAPPELPHLILRSENSRLRLQASPARVDLISTGGDSDNENTSEFLSFATELFANYLETMAARAARVACVVQRLASHESPAKEIAQHFCRPEWLNDPLKRPSDFELHAAKRFEMAGIMVNSWFRCKSARIRKETQPDITGILVEQDFNTPAEELESQSFSRQQIGQFFGHCPGEFETVLQRYFPSRSAET